MTVRGTVTRRFDPARNLEGTPGRMVLENGFVCDTLELPWMWNRRGVSCAMADTYHGRVEYSDALKRSVIKFDDKNGRVAMEIHNGNFADERLGEVSDVHGCTLVGDGYGPIWRKGGVTQWGIQNSLQTLARLISSLVDQNEVAGCHDVEITYLWTEGTELPDEPKEVR